MTIRELRVLYVTRAVSTPVHDGTTIATPPVAAALLASVIGDEPIEVFGILCLTTRHTLICYHEVARGTLDRAIVEPREVLKAALLSNAASVVVGHNHPSGDPAPSAEDRELTRRLMEAGTLVGIDLLDHIIVGNGRHYSFREHGEL
jgi:DNA repair protein RadC